MRFIQQLHQYLSTRLFYPIAAASFFASVMLFGRIRMTQSGTGFFLAWNLFLAWVPYLMALWSEAIAKRYPQTWLRLVIPGLLWLIFLPNAPYLLTDFVHFPYMNFVWWYDVGMLFTFAWAGGLLGVASLHMMQELVRKRAGAVIAWSFILGSALLNGIGVYIGRFLRWNSWDIISSPRALADNMLAVFSSPETYPRLIGVSGFFACFLLLGYLTLNAARNVR